jgi:hypothetical protein
MWNPSFPVTKAGISKFKFYRNSQPRDAENDPRTAVYANSAVSCFYGRSEKELLFHYDELPDVEVSKMRLVSAKMKVTYRGSSEKLAGKMVSCATFQPMPNVVANDMDKVGELYFYNEKSRWYKPLPNTLLSFAVRGYSDGTRVENDQLISEDPDYTNVLKSQAVINGIWSKSLNLSELNRGLTCTYLPVDQDSAIFTTPGTIRGSSLTKLIDHEYQFNNCYYNDFSKVIPDGPQAGQSYIDNVGSPVIDLHGGRMGFIVVGEGLPDENTAIDVEFYYNWEILPTVSSASSMRNYANCFVPSSAMYSEIMSNMKVSDASITILKNSDLVSPTPLPQKLGWSLDSIINNAAKFISGGLKSVGL